MVSRLKSSLRHSESWFVNITHPVTPNHSQEAEAHCCLSDQEHGPEAIKDHLRHYFGCLEITDRFCFLDLEIPEGPNLKKNPIWIYEANVECESLKANGISADTIESKVKEQLDRKMGSLAVAIEAQYKRTQVLHQDLLQAPDPGSPDTRGHLVHNVENSYRDWRQWKVC